MRNYLLILVGIFIIVSRASAEPPDCSKFKQFKGPVDHYYKVGKTGLDDWQSALHELMKNPLASSCFLVRDLKPVHQKRILMEQTASVKPVWILRGLRYLTNCKDFGGRLIHKELLDPQSARGEYLLRDDAENIPFFKTWMSHETTVIAPVEVQQQIISKWQDWYGSEAESFAFQQCGDLNDWYF